jgi:membrane associated rhomboid family serine protease
MVTIELCLTGSDNGYLIPPGWRSFSFAYGAFWQPLLDGVQPIFPLQAYSMFLSHAFLHGGALHVVMNAVILLSLGKLIAERMGTGFMLLVFAVSAVAGGVGFGLLATTSAPMIGASGAVFGYFGVWQYWEMQARRAQKLSLKPVLSMVFGLIAVNVIMAVMLDGGLAWEAHLGGFIGGFFLAFITSRLVGARQYRR